MKQKFFIFYICSVLLLAASCDNSKRKNNTNNTPPNTDPAHIAQQQPQTNTSRVCKGHSALHNKKATTSLSLLCTTAFSGNTKPIAKALKELPLHVQPTVTKIMMDPCVPNELKCIIETSLIKNKLTVKHLSPELKEKLNLPEKVAGFHILPLGTNFHTKSHGETSNEKPTSLNTQVESTINTNHLENEEAVYVSDRPAGEVYNDTLAFMHEVAHSYFDAWLNSNLTALLAFLPEEVMWVDNQVNYVESDFYDFIAERFAYEKEVELMLTTANHYYPKTKRFSTLSIDTYEDSLAHFVVETYNITNPLAVWLSTESLSVDEVLSSTWY